MYNKPNFKRYIVGEIVGGALNAVGSIATTAMQNEFNRKEAEKQRNWSEKMYNEQNAWNYQMWQEEKAYNTPEAQVERLREAGLNPMFYGLDGNSTGGGFDAAQPLGYDRASMQGAENPLAAGVAGALQAAQVANIEAQTEKTKSETHAIDAKLPFEVENLKSQVRNSSLDADAKEVVNKYLDAQQQAELRVKDMTAQEADASIQRAFAEIDKMDYEKRTMMISWLETHEKILTLQKNRELTDKQMGELDSLIRYNNNMAAKIGLDVKNYDDITVIGTASHSIKAGPFTVQEGEPITLAMLKALQEQNRQAKEKQDKKGTKSDSAFKPAEGNPYQGPIYD